MPDEHQPTRAHNGVAVAPGSFDAFVLPHLPVLWRVARSLSRNTHDAEDLVQDTLVRAYKGLDRFDGAHPRAWLLTIMRNAHINQHRRQRPGLLHDPAFAAEADRRNLTAPSRQIQTYLDGGLDPITATRVAAHLDACRRCGLTAADYRHLKTALADTAGDVPADAIERLHHIAADLAAGDRRPS